MKAFSMVAVAVPIAVVPLDTAAHAFVPPGRGRVKAQVRWSPCRPGQRLSSLELRDALVTYSLADVTVVDCSPESATFAYTSVRMSAAH